MLTLKFGKIWHTISSFYGFALILDNFSRWIRMFLFLFMKTDQSAGYLLGNRPCSGPAARSQSLLPSRKYARPPWEWPPPCLEKNNNSMILIISRAHQILVRPTEKNWSKLSNYFHSKELVKHIPLQKIIWTAAIRKLPHPCAIHPALLQRAVRCETARSFESWQRRDLKSFCLFLFFSQWWCFPSNSEEGPLSASGQNSLWYITSSECGHLDWCANRIIVVSRWQLFSLATRASFGVRWANFPPRFSWANALQSWR